MKRQKTIILIAILLLALLSLTACIDSSESPINESPINESLPSNGLAANGDQNTAYDDATETTPSPPAAIPSTFTIASLSEAMADVIEQVRPSVVYISAEVETTGFFGFSSTETRSGSGVILSHDGYILTNNHVVENATKLEVTLPDSGGIYTAELIGTDPLTDLAVIKANGSGFPTASFGDATNLRPGNLVIAIGNPLGLEGGPTITLGVVSNTERSFRMGETAYYDIIQTDAAINPGNSGGPLIDLNGLIIGINTVMIGGAENIGFAVSATTAEPVFTSLIKPSHKVVRAWLGVVLQTVTPDIATMLRSSIKSGVLVTSIEKGSPASKAGIERYDIITQFNGEAVTEATQLIKKLWQHQPGELVELVFWRGDKEHTVSLTLAERPDN